VLFQSYNYAENKVVKPHRAGYYFLKNEMEKNLGKTSKFHVVGKLGGTAMEWQSREMMKFILIRKGLKWQEYSLTGSVQKDIVSFIDIFYYKDRIIKSITKEEQALIDKYYDKREPFNGYYYKYIPIEEEDREKLNKIFIKYDLIPAEDFVTIDLHDCAELAEVQEVF
jgi:hypothetical protein